VVFLLVLQLRRLVRVSMWSCDERKRMREEVGLGGSSDKVSAPRRWLTFDGTALGTQWFFILNSARWSKRHVCTIFRRCRHREASSLFLHRRFLYRMRHQKLPFFRSKRKLSAAKYPNQFSLGSCSDFLQQQARGFSVRECSLPLFPFIL
jgi:hypothetical protein